MYVPTQLRVERLLPQDAFGIDTPNPVLSWDLLPAGKAQQQCNLQALKSTLL